MRTSAVNIALDDDISCSVRRGQHGEYDTDASGNLAVRTCSPELFSDCKLVSSSRQVLPVEHNGAGRPLFVKLIIHDGRPFIRQTCGIFCHEQGVQYVSRQRETKRPGLRHVIIYSTRVPLKM